MHRYEPERNGEPNLSGSEARESIDRREFLRTAATGTVGTAAAVGAVGTAAGQETGSESSGNASAGGGGPTQSVAVGPNNSLKFKPAETTIAPGTTVEWTWDSDNHNIVPSSQPEGTNWEGTAGPASKTYNTGHSYSHTFTTTGTFEYYCDPHQASGMDGAITVQPGGASSGASEPPIPNQAITLGIAATTTMLSTLGLAYVFIKYGGDYDSTTSN